MKLPESELNLELRDTQWPFVPPVRERQVARAILFDGSGLLYFVRVTRDDEFGCGTFLETSGGGVEPGETTETAILRELREELGAQAEIVGKIGVVCDYYNLIHRRNINHYFLCRVLAFGPTHRTREEQERWQLSAVRLTPQEAQAEYLTRANSRLGRLIANRELPVLRAVWEEE